MDDDIYTKENLGRRWAISRNIHGEWVHLVERSPLFNEGDALKVLAALNTTPTRSALNHYFPENSAGQRCPTFEVMIEFLGLDPTHPRYAKSKDAVGV